jgi:hypothetical protein
MWWRGLPANLPPRPRLRAGTSPGTWVEEQLVAGLLVVAGRARVVALRLQSLLQHLAADGAVVHNQTRIIVTAELGEEVRAAARAAKATHFIWKPAQISSPRRCRGVCLVSGEGV